MRLEHEGLVTSVPGADTSSRARARPSCSRSSRSGRRSRAWPPASSRSGASEEAIASLRAIFATFEGDRIAAHLDEYSEANLRFHQRIIDLSGCEALRRTADGILIHVRSIRHRTIGENHRFERSIVDHMQIIEALERRDAEARRAARPRPRARARRARRRERQRSEPHRLPTATRELMAQTAPVAIRTNEQQRHFEQRRARRRAGSQGARRRQGPGHDARPGGPVVHADPRLARRRTSSRSSCPAAATSRAGSCRTSPTSTACTSRC